jgi:hypothetical protein
MPNITWQFLTFTPDTPSAHALVGSLMAEGVTSRVIANTPLLGEGQPCSVFVERAQLHRAQWLLAQGHFTDDELTLLATGQSAPEEPPR